MNSYDIFVFACQKFFPDLQVKEKESSFFMKLVGWLLWFNPSFMKSYTTTIGSTVYVPSKADTNVEDRLVLLHELVHIQDSKKYSSFLFSLLYLCPQILALIALPLFIVSWKIALPFLLFLLPLPAYFRMKFELRAYLAQLYAYHQYKAVYGTAFDIDAIAENLKKQFCNSSYYFMWPFGVNNQFKDAVAKIKSGQRPYQSPYFDVLDKLIEKI